MIGEYTYYNQESGEIIGTVVGAPDQNLGALFSVIDGCFPGDRYYVSNGEAVLKAPFSVAVSGNVISGIPAGTTALVDGAPVSIEGSALEIDEIPNKRTQIVLMNVRYLTDEIIL